MNRKRVRLGKIASAGLLWLAAMVPLTAQSGVLRPDGAQAQSLTALGARVVVLVFGATDCPISNRYVPEVDRMSREFLGKSVEVRWIFPNPGDTPEVVLTHLNEFKTLTPGLVDSKQELVKQAGASVTPEAAVFAVENGKMRLVYRGRIDDRYIAFGQERPRATRHELEEAIRAELAGRPAPAPGGEPVGCSIVPRTR